MESWLVGRYRYLPLGLAQKKKQDATKWKKLSFVLYTRNLQASKIKGFFGNPAFLMVSTTNSFRNIGPMSHSKGGTGQFKMAPGYLV